MKAVDSYGLDGGSSVSSLASEDAKKGARLKKKKQLMIMMAKKEQAMGGRSTRLPVPELLSRAMLASEKSESVKVATTFVSNSRLLQLEQMEQFERSMIGSLNGSSCSLTGGLGGLGGSGGSSSSSLISSLQLPLIPGSSLESVSHAMLPRQFTTGHMRAYSVDSLTENGVEKRERTMHELVTQIEEHSKLDLDPPIFVPRLGELSVDKISWNKSLRRPSPPSNRGRSSSPPLRANAANAANSANSEGLAGLVGSVEAPTSAMNTEFDSLNRTSGPEALVPREGQLPKPRKQVLTQQQAQQQLAQKDRLPPINIIGCHHPIELLLFKADQRSRKMQRAMRLKMEASDSYQQHLEDLVTQRMTRLKHFEEMKARAQCQRVWMTLIFCLKFVHNSHPGYRRAISSYMKTFHYINSAALITKSFMNWYRRRIFQKYRLGLRSFSQNKSNGLFNLIFNFRLFRKRRAITRIRSFLKNLQEKKKIALLVRRFLYSVKKVQHVMRDFLACKKARLLVLGKIWEKIESEYVRNIIKVRDDARKARNLFQSETLKIDYKTRVELESQERRWIAIDKKMEENLNRHKNLNRLKNKQATEVMNQYYLPDTIRQATLLRILDTCRKEYFLKRHEIGRRGMVKRREFSEEDALNLLNGRLDTASILVRDKAADGGILRAMHRASAVTYDPLIIFSTLDKSQLLNRIKELHRSLGTVVQKLYETFG